MSIKNLIGDAIDSFIYWHLDFDRVGEKKIKLSIDLWHKGGYLNQKLAQLLWIHIQKQYSCSIAPMISIGANLRIEHCMGTTIGKTAILGDNVRIYQNVDVIAKIVGDQKRLDHQERRHAKIGNNVILSAGCTIIGPITIGDDCIIGARAIVTHDIPPHSVVIGTNCISPRRADQIAPYFEDSRKKKNSS